MKKLIEKLKEMNTSKMLIGIMEKFEKIANYKFYVMDKKVSDIASITNILRVDLEQDSEIYATFTNLAEVLESVLEFKPYSELEENTGFYEEIELIEYRSEANFIKEMIKFLKE